MTDQQFCLRWNNHQSTLVAVFDGLLEKGVLVDCTLAAEGQQLTAHKVVLAACSPFLETLLSRHYDKHPILILKDVKFSELKAMMDYMYRGEVNISQDQLGTFLKAAESLQIKGLSDGGGEKESHPATKTRQYERKPLRPTSPLRNSMPPSVGNPPTAVPEGKRNSVPPAPPLPYLHNSIRNSLKSSPLLVDIPEDNAVRRPGSISPQPRKKKKLRDSEEVNPLNNNVVCKVELEEPPVTPAAATAAARPSPEPATAPPRVPSPDDKSDTALDKTDPVAHLKHELIEEEEDINEDSMELTLDEGDDGEAGPSHNEGDFNDFYGGSQDGDNRDSQGFQDLLKVSWEAWRAATEGPDGEKAVEAGPQVLSENPVNMFNKSLPLAAVPTNGHGSESPKNVECGRCGRRYKLKSSLRNHQKWECGKEPRFQCPYCVYRAKQKMHVERHIERMHREQLRAFYDNNDLIENHFDKALFGSMCELAKTDPPVQQPPSAFCQ